MTTNWATIAVVTALILFNATNVWANDIYINQVGDDVTISITQDGENNRISTKHDTTTNTPSKATFVGKNQTLTINQTGDNNMLGLYKHTYGSDTQSSGTMTATQTGDDNTMRLDNHGDNNNFTAVQETDGSTMDLQIDYNNNTVVAKQKCSETICNADTMNMWVIGDSNNVKLGQGYKISSSGNWDYDYQEHGGHDMDLDITGSYNGVTLSQRSNNNTSDHTMAVDINSDSNTVHVIQEHNADKNLTLTINNDYNDVSIHQRKSHGHTATVTLGGTYGTDLDLQQGTNSTTQGLSYTLNQYCTTAGGCAVSVTQQ
jgi:hypothetical protein